MSDKDENDKKGVDALIEIPEAVPLIKIQDGRVVFPWVKFEITLPESQSLEISELLSQKPFVVLAPLTSDGKTFQAGVLGKAKLKEEFGNVLEFLSLIRAKFEEITIPQKHTHARWSPIVDVSISAELAASPAFQNLLRYLQDLFADYLGGLAVNLQDGAKEFFSRPSVEYAMERVNEVNAESLSVALDGIMNLLNLVVKVKNDKKVDLLVPSLVVLAEPDLEVRLNRVIELLYMLVNEIPIIVKDTEEDKAVESLSITESPAPVKESGQVPPKKDDTPAADSNEKLTVHEFLIEPREAQRRFRSLDRLDFDEGSINLRELSPSEASAPRKMFYGFVDQYIVDQELAKEQIFRKWILFRQGLNDFERPEPGGMFLGPTGVGKTDLVRVFFQFLFGVSASKKHGFVRIDCGDLKEPHEVTAFLTGSPPGYAAFGKESPISQWSLDKAYVLYRLREKFKENPKELAEIMQKVATLEAYLDMGHEGPPTKSVYAHLRKITGWDPDDCFRLVLFDEIEKAHPNIYDFFMRILDDGTLVLKNGETTVFGNTLMFWTSNIYGREIAQAITGKGVISMPPRRVENLHQNLYNETMDAVDRTCPAYFIGRIGKENLRVLHPLTEKNLLEALEFMELPKLADFLREKLSMEIYITNRAKMFIVSEAMDDTNRALGERALQSVIKRKVREPISLLLEMEDENGLRRGDKILIDTKDKEDGSGEKLIIKRLDRDS